MRCIRATGLHDPAAPGAGLVVVVLGVGVFDVEGEGAEGRAEDDGGEGGDGGGGLVAGVEGGGLVVGVDCEVGEGGEGGEDGEVGGGVL